MPDEAFFSLDTDDQAELNDLAAEDRERDEAYELSEPVDGGDDPEESTTKRKYRGAHNLDNIQAEEDTTGSLGFRFLQIERQWLHYMRLIEGDMFMLQGLRQKYQPPTADSPIVVRTVHYNGERHPVTRKRVFTVPVALLPLRDDLAVHKFKLLAGPRWTQRPPTDSGVGEVEVEVWGNEGYFKISIEDLPEPIQNLKFASDVLDQLIANANNTAKDDMTDIPIDERHVVARYKRNPKFDRFGHHASKDDFPIEWLHITADERQQLVGEDAFLARERERGEDYSINRKERTLQRKRDKREWMDTLNPAERSAVETAEARSDEFEVYRDAERWREKRKIGLRPMTVEEVQAELERQRRREAGEPAQADNVDATQKELPLAEGSDGSTIPPPDTPPSA
ncbi:mitochondrial ribosomal subunit protein-domain-containing protein [Auriculariales sp. MPI-PUGE-AT-0066]|nr:mitochondrial ribosomal subunit protein-domain-containing protein [Auriculariales sp. MPI-PUGE-AT-0066]